MFVKRIAVFVSAAVMALWASTSAYAEGELEHLTFGVFVNPVGAPHAFIDGDISHPKGVDVDIIYELKRRLGFNIKDSRVFPVSLSEGFKRLDTGEGQILGGGVSYTKERAQKYDFTPIFFESSLAVMYSKRKNPNMKSVKEIRGMKIGVVRGTTSEAYAERYGATPVFINNLILSYFQVAMGTLDGVIYDRPPMADFAAALKSLDLGLTTEPFGQEECRFVLALPKNWRYSDIVNQEIDNMVADGTMHKILKKWNAK